MYNRAYKEETFRTRTGSHGTKGNRRGEHHFASDGMHKSLSSEEWTKGDIKQALQDIVELRQSIYDKCVANRKILNRKSARSYINNRGRDMYSQQQNGRNLSDLELLYLQHYITGLEQIKLQDRLTGKKDRVGDVANRFVDIAREELDEDTFSKILERAKYE